VIPQPVLRFLLRGLFRLLYRVEVHGVEHLRTPAARMLIVVNHVSLLDAPLLLAFLDRPAVYAINTRVAEWWWLRPAHRLAELLPLDPTNPLAVKTLLAKVKEGRPCVIFPEGRISVTGALMKIYAGPAWIADRADALVLPVRIEGAERSPFSYLTRGEVRRRWFPKIRLTALAPVRLSVDPTLRGRERRRHANLRLYDIMSDLVFRTQALGPTLIEAILRARSIHGGGFVALDDVNQRRLTYNRLLAGALALSGPLVQGSARGETVGLLLPNASAAVVAFLAVQVAGRVPAMLNFSTGTANMLAALVAARIGTIVTSREFIERARLGPAVEELGERARLIWLEDVAAGFGRLARLRALAGLVGLRRRYRALGVRSEDPAVILFTSGSEGRPKGVVLSHANLLANCAQAAARVDFNELDLCFNALPLFHSFGLTGGTLLPLVGGVPVLLYPSPLHFRIVPEMVYDSNATIMFGTNSFLKGYARAADPYDFRSLRYVFAGAEPIQDETSELWFEKFGIRLLTGYGTTETAPVLALNTRMHYRRRTVGRFLPGIEWRLEPVPGIAEGGRLWVRGPNVMLGYLRYERPGEIEPPPDGWYDTGDIVAVDREGYVTILGRAKRFAKVGGEMVSLATVEEFLAQAFSEAQHAVVAVADRRKGEHILLVTTARGLDRSRLARAARERGVSEIHVPAEILEVDALPLLGTGKIDYPAVQRLVAERREAAGVA
jgi:acyl-[acyl-carrier-protein]-phospholipid O-acyltransferase/long-chain-fatty-acid--[acyl-carrier-protein] ligase